MENSYYGFHSQSGRSGNGKLHLLLLLLYLIKSAASHSVYNNTVYLINLVIFYH